MKINVKRGFIHISYPMGMPTPAVSKINASVTWTCERHFNDTDINTGLWVFLAAFCCVFDLSKSLKERTRISSKRWESKTTKNKNEKVSKTTTNVAWRLNLKWGCLCKDRKKACVGRRKIINWKHKHLEKTFHQKISTTSEITSFNSFVDKLAKRRNAINNRKFSTWHLKSFKAKKKNVFFSLKLLWLRMENVSWRRRRRRTAYVESTLLISIIMPNHLMIKNPTLPTTTRL